MIDMANFTPVSALLGGMLIGTAALWLLLANGRIAGISGIFSGLFSLSMADKRWRLMFLAGLLLGPQLWQLAGGELPIFPKHSVFWLMAAGLLVGLGTGVGSGCTSGHGICGIGRLSPRSLVATVTFMVSAIVTVVIINQFNVIAGGL
ncbi:YeeE/YedE family protein [Corallincola luteus]|uniref:YeeE/YedE family protein n=1 Tax=Corallincola luteus TaxID=1775177 RepID=A0ABY2AP60_9GAMM|nr:YeeE/YedE family protein [Corallincola luteus]